jgi:hypothetical protein
MRATGRWQVRLLTHGLRQGYGAMNATRYRNSGGRDGNFSGQFRHCTIGLVADKSPKSEQVLLHAVQDQSGKISVTRASARDGSVGTFTFANIVEMRVALGDGQDVDKILQELTDSGTVEFSATELKDSIQ